MQARGYVRFRIDGQLCRSGQLPKLKVQTEKHDIDVVVDRLKVRPAMQQRLAESPEAALLLAQGRVIALGQPAALSIYLTPALPALFATTLLVSWSHGCFLQLAPMGACQLATGWARKRCLCGRVVAFPSWAWPQGAIKGWDQTQPPSRCCKLGQTLRL